MDIFNIRASETKNVVLILDSEGEQIKMIKSHFYNSRFYACSEHCPFCSIHNTHHNLSDFKSHSKVYATVYDLDLEKERVLMVGINLFKNIVDELEMDTNSHKVVTISRSSTWENKFPSWKVSIGKKIEDIQNSTTIKLSDIKPNFKEPEYDELAKIMLSVIG
jgi:hypothetical protein